MSGVNLAVMVGLVADEVRINKTGSGYAINFVLAINEEIDKPSAFVSCVKFQNTDRIFFKQGDTLSVTGTLRTDSWEKDGNRQWKTVVKTDRVDRISNS